MHEPPALTDEAVEIWAALLMSLKARLDAGDVAGDQDDDDS